MQDSTPGIQVINISGKTNREFFDLYAQPGRIGLSGGATWVDDAICRAQRHLDEGRQWAAWSHAFIFQGRRCDGQHWVIESDLQVHRKHIQLGVQENRITKYCDEELYSNLAVLDLGLTEAQVNCVLTEALDLVAGHAKYSVRELFGTLLALQHPGLRGRGNLLARDSSLYCSAFVRHLFSKINLDLAPNVDIKNTTPEDVARTPLPHTAWVMQRWTPHSKLAKWGSRLRRHVGARIRQLKRRRTPRS